MLFKNQPPRTNVATVARNLAAVAVLEARPAPIILLESETIFQP
jgi:hypothetical protein